MALSPRPAALTRAVEYLQSIAPLSLAGSWDNVGLLVDAGKELASTGPLVVLLTNDLTDKVVREAVGMKAGLVVTYHPTPFGGVKKLVREDRTARVVLSCVANGIAVYSPHTAMDCTVGGVNDWLAAGVLGREFDADALLAAAKAVSEDVPPEVPVRPITPSKPPAVPGSGEGRLVTLPEPTPLLEVIHRVKRMTGLDHLNVCVADHVLPADKATPTSVVAAASETLVTTVGICAGSGRSVLPKAKADVWLTGELAHHDCIAAAAGGTSVIVCNHSNTERGYLPHLATRMAAALGTDVDVRVTEVDADPLTTV